MLRPEKQDLGLFAAGVDAIVEAQQRVALNYFEDGSVEAACPPLQGAAAHHGLRQLAGKEIDDPEVRRLFTREALLASDWYQERLRSQAAARHRVMEPSRGSAAILPGRRVCHSPAWTCKTG